MFARIIKASAIVFFEIILTVDSCVCSCVLIAFYAYLKGRAGLDVLLFSLELKQENRLLMSKTNVETVGKRKNKKNANFNPVHMT